MLLHVSWRSCLCICTHSIFQSEGVTLSLQEHGKSLDLPGDYVVDNVRADASHALARHMERTSLA